MRNHSATPDNILRITRIRSSKLSHHYTIVPVLVQTKLCNPETVKVCHLNFGCLSPVRRRCVHAF